MPSDARRRILEASLLLFKSDPSSTRIEDIDLDEQNDRFAEFLGGYLPRIYEIVARLESARHADRRSPALFEDRRRERWRNSHELARAIELGAARERPHHRRTFCLVGPAGRA